MDTDGPIKLTRQQLYDEVWSEPMTKLAVKYGLSDVGLAKICNRNHIPKPKVGHWMTSTFPDTNIKGLTPDISYQSRHCNAARESLRQEIMRMMFPQRSGGTSLSTRHINTEQLRLPICLLELRTGVYFLRWKGAWSHAVPSLLYYGEPNFIIRSVPGRERLLYFFGTPIRDGPMRMRFSSP